MANFNLNKVILAGRLTADPELRTTQDGKSVTSFTLAVNRQYQKGGETTADFINCVAWGQAAEFITKYFHKASSICVEGSIQTRNWTDNNNQKRFTTEVIVSSQYFVDSKNESAQPTTPPSEPPMQNLGNDEDLPF